jgi:hypothetical protein
MMILRCGSNAVQWSMMIMLCVERRRAVGCWLFGTPVLHCDACWYDGERLGFHSELANPHPIM